MTDFETLLEHELTDAAERRAQPLWRRVTGIGTPRFGPDLEPRSRRGPLAVAVGAALLVLTPIGLVGGGAVLSGNQMDANRPVATNRGGGTPTVPIPGSDTTIAAGSTARGDWRLAARECGAGQLALTLDGSGAAICQDPGTPITIETRYEERLDETFVYGLVGRQVEKVRVELQGKPVEVRARDAGAPLPEDTRFYLARVPGRRSAAKAAGLSKGGHPVACAPVARCDTGGSASGRGGGSRSGSPGGDRGGSSSSSGKSPSASSGGEHNEQRRAAAPERVHVLPASRPTVVDLGLTAGGATPQQMQWNLLAYSCGDDALHHVMFQVAFDGRRARTEACRWQLRGVEPPPVTAASSYVAGADLTVIYGVVLTRAKSLSVRHNGQRTDVPVKKDTAKRGGRNKLPAGLRFFSLAVPGRQALQDVDATGDRSAIRCTADNDATRAPAFYKLNCRSGGS